MLQSQQKFLNAHLATWAIDYCAGLAAHCENGYMKAVAQLTHDSLQTENDPIDDLSRRIELSL